MRNIEILREILKIMDDADYSHWGRVADYARLAAIRELIAAERPTLAAQQDAHNKDQLKLEGIE